MSTDGRGSRQTGDEAAGEKERRFRQVQCRRLERYLQLRRDRGEEGAREELLVGYPERQRALMGPYLANSRLAEGFAEVVPIFADIGLTVDYIDVSTDTCDAALEVLTTCMCRRAADDLGVEDAGGVLCELDLDATRRAFSDVSVEPIRRVVDGAAFCAFRYSRSGATAREQG